MPDIIKEAEQIAARRFYEHDFYRLRELRDFGLISNQTFMRLVLGGPDA